MKQFQDRAAAGRALAERLEPLRERRPVVLGLPRGGVPVAFEVAEALDAPLDVIVVRKLGVPWQPELAMGAIGEDGARVLSSRLLARLGITADRVAEVERHEQAVLRDRAERFRRGRPRTDVTGRTVVVVDDGIATGSTARVACQVARLHGAATIVLATPVAPRDTVQSLSEADTVVSLLQPRDFRAVGQYYRDFSETTDADVVALLDRRRSAPDRSAGHHGRGRAERTLDADVTVPGPGVELPGHLHVPGEARGVVLFAHGSGSSRHSPRNRFVAQELNRAGFGTLLLDLLTREEEQDRANVFDLPLLAARLVEATRWLRGHPRAAACRMGYFGASTGAGAALLAAAETDLDVAAVVSRGGRPDLAGAALARVRAPTLLIVGGADRVVLELNSRAQQQLRCPNRLEVVGGATHLFEEPGALERVAALASAWFGKYLAAEGTGPA